MRLFHRTTEEAARAIQSEGFRDATGEYMTSNRYTGVWLSNVPLDANEGAPGDVLLEIVLNMTDAELEHYEWIEEGKRYREFLVPADVINAHGATRRIARDEEEAIILDWLP